MRSAVAEPIVQPLPVLDIEQIEEDLAHVVCEIHDRMALCGETFDFDGSEEEEITCRLCAEAGDQGMTCAVDPQCPGLRTRWQRFLHRVTGGRRG